MIESEARKQAAIKKIDKQVEKQYYLIISGMTIFLGQVGWALPTR
ncbi:MAG TPA: hypothetical protein VK211_19820 [Kamptonema sp.]|nr:hypothetical protein [Kamptonema sp.]